MEIIYSSKVLIIILGLAYFAALAEAQKGLEHKEREEDGRNSVDRLKIEGIVERPEGLGRSDKYWYANTRVYTETGQTAFIRENGSFVLHNLFWGAHIIYVSSPVASYAPVRVDLLSKGKWRVRKHNILQPAKTEVIHGPLRFVPLGPTRYFQAREQWRVTDLLFNPMVLMSVVPLLLMLVLPKLSDPETRKEMEAQLQMPKTETPDLSELLMNYLPLGGSGGGGSGTADGRRSVRGSGNVGPAMSRGGRRKDK